MALGYGQLSLKEQDCEKMSFAVPGILNIIKSHVFWIKNCTKLLVSFNGSFKTAAI